MLGIPLSAPGGDLSKWFIPTYVGHTRAVNPVNIYCPVHPHMRGAYHRARNGVAYVARFIPTYVGHTGIGFDRYNALSVHPHLRGAYRRPSTSMACCRGSSPPTWGIPCTLSAFLTAFRFIPTYVGHTLCPARSHTSVTVHPHLRGAYAPVSWRSHSVPVHPHLRGAYKRECNQPSCRSGSSPPTWGIRNLSL